MNGSAVTLTLSEAVLRIDTVTVAYAAPASGDKLQDADNLKLPVPDFAAQTATNDTPEDTTPPIVRLGVDQRDDDDAHLRRGAGRDRDAV